MRTVSLSDQEWWALPTECPSRHENTALLNLVSVKTIMSAQKKRCTEIDFRPYKPKVAQAAEHQQNMSDASALPGTSSPPSIGTKKRKVSSLGDSTKKVVTGPPKKLVLLQERDGSDLAATFLVRHESPWNTYRQTLRCTLAGDVLIAARRAGPSQAVAIREYRQSNADHMLQLYRTLSHPNILAARECFVDNGSLYILVDDLPLTLEHLVGCRVLYPTEPELASLVWQVLNGIDYLAQSAWEHQSLSCQNILLGLDGIVKIGALESCVGGPADRIRRTYTQALACITMELMQKYVKEDGVVGIDDVHRWPLDSHAFGFLSAIWTSNSFATLNQHPLVRKQHRLVGELVLLARTVLLSARVFFSPEK
ncbi:hypothetical protein N7488_008956 [Penicillium malachiteum]|nr:hypothetical protein N7488_008956 [Penicillium malachiteum]